MFGILWKTSRTYCSGAMFINPKSICHFLYPMKVPHFGIIFNIFILKPFEGSASQTKPTTPGINIWDFSVNHVKFQQHLLISIADFSITKVKSWIFSIVPRSLATKLLRAVRVTGFLVRPKILSLTNECPVL